MTYKVETDGGKYTFINDNGVVSVLRHGEAWKEGTGDKSLLSLLHLLEDYEAVVEMAARGDQDPATLAKAAMAVLPGGGRP